MTELNSFVHPGDGGVKAKTGMEKIGALSVEDRHELRLVCPRGLTSSRQEAAEATLHFQMPGRCVWRADSSNDLQPHI